MKQLLLTTAGFTYCVVLNYLHFNNILNTEFKNNFLKNKNIEKN